MAMILSGVISSSSNINVVAGFLLLLATTLLLLFSFYKSKISSSTHHHLHLPPGPAALPLVGNLHQLDSAAPHVYLWKLSHKYGPLTFLRLGSRPTLVVSSAKMAREVLETHDLHFCTRPSLLAQQKLSYNGLDLGFAPYNSNWRDLRKLFVQHLFGHSMFQLHRRVREDEVSITLRNLKQLVAKSPDDDQPMINLSTILMHLTSNIIFRVAFGKRFDEYEGRIRGAGADFRELIVEAQCVLASFFVSDYLPLMGWVDTLTGLRARLDKVYEQLDDFYQHLIDDHLHELERRSTCSSTSEDDDGAYIVHVLLRRMKNRTDFNFSFDNIKAILMNVYLAGTSTSAAAVEWGMAYLMKNQSKMNKAQQEIRSSVGRKPCVDEDDLKNLPYLKAVVKETFRMQPPSPLLLPRETIKDCKLGSYNIPARTLVYVNAWAIGRDPEAWEDPEEFCPERFMHGSSSTVDYRGVDLELIPFGAGRRRCPGMEMGAVTVELVLANLLYCFDWEMPIGMDREDLDFDASLGITMHKKNALSLIATNHYF